MKAQLEEQFQQAGLSDFKWINPCDIVVAHWVRIKCLFGCAEYGNASCPPNTPSVHDCIEFLKEYNQAVLFKLTVNASKDNYPAAWSTKMTEALMGIERQLFLQGYYKVFLLNQTCCSLCPSCEKEKNLCNNKKKSRPSAEAFAIDVYSTARNAGFDLRVINKPETEISRIAVLLIK
ncbi:MAG: DUF2284 domain-containing protein [Bacteroidales bacterium]|nr:DUF2284 domain-containing protein [Bacteroidales bacterium]